MIATASLSAVVGGRWASRSSMRVSASGRAAIRWARSARRAGLAEQAGRVVAVGEGGVARVGAAGGEDPVVAFGGYLAGEVAVGGHDHTRGACGVVEERHECVRLGVSEGGP